jgi:glucokinase
MTAPRATALVSDMGGTHSRFARVDLVTGALSDIRAYASREHAQAIDAVRAYLAEIAPEPFPLSAAIAAAGPIADGQVHFTNLRWTLSENELRGLGFGAARLVNDFESLAWATERLAAGDVHEIGTARPGLAGATRAVIGPGTGFGASALVRGLGGAIALAAEGGHASFAPCDDVEREIARVLAGKFSHVSIERILSGPGLQNLHAALNTIEGVPGDIPDPTEITRRGLAGEAPFTRTLARFLAILASVAGDFALCYGARDGIYIAGGITPSILSALDAGAFRRRFAAKGRFEAYLEAIPTRVILHPHAAFLGAAEVARLIAAPAAKAPQP